MRKGDEGKQRAEESEERQQVGEEERWSTPMSSPAVKRRGRPFKAETWERERAASCGSLDSWSLKRKRKEVEGREDEEEKRQDTEETERAFKRSDMTLRSPENKEKAKIDESKEGTEKEQKMGKKREGVDDEWAQKMFEELKDMRKSMREDNEVCLRKIEGREPVEKVEKAKETWQEKMLEEITSIKNKIEQERKRSRVKSERMRKEIEDLRREGAEERRKLEEKIRRMEEQWRKKETETRSKEKEKEGLTRKVGEQTEIKELERGSIDKTIEKRIDEMEKEQEVKEKKERRNNVLIRGQEIENGKNAEQTVKEIIEDITGRGDGDMRWEEVVEIGGQKGRAILVKFGSWGMKRKVMNSKNRLRGRRVYIDDDLTKREREVQKAIVRRAKEERENGKTTKVGYKKLRIEEKCWVWNERKKELVEMNEKRSDS